MDIKIDKGLPIPTRNGNRGSKYAHVVRALEIGDSFWIPKDEFGTGFRAAIRILCKTIQIKTTVRTEVKDDVQGWRVWRIPDNDYHSELL